MNDTDIGLLGMAAVGVIAGVGFAALGTMMGAAPIDYATAYRGVGYAAAYGCMAFAAVPLGVLLGKALITRSAEP